MVNTYSKPLDAGVQYLPKRYETLNLVKLMIFAIILIPFPTYILR